MAAVIDHHHLAAQTKLLQALHPVIQGWSKYFSTVCSKETFSKVDKALLHQLRAWSIARHPKKARTGTKAKYWKAANGKLAFSPRDSRLRFHFHSETLLKRHVQVQGNRSPSESDWMYWSTRLGQRPGVSTSRAKLLKRQKGKCPRCGLSYKEGDVLEEITSFPKHTAERMCTTTGNSSIDTATMQRRLRTVEGMRHKHQALEEPCAGKLARTVLKQRRGERSPRRL